MRRDVYVLWHAPRMLAHDAHDHHLHRHGHCRHHHRHRHHSTNTTTNSTNTSSHLVVRSAVALQLPDQVQPRVQLHQPVKALQSTYPSRHTPKTHTHQDTHPDKPFKTFACPHTNEGMLPTTPTQSAHTHQDAMTAARPGSTVSAAPSWVGGWGRAHVAGVVKAAPETVKHWDAGALSVLACGRFRQYEECTLQLAGQN